jgi:hypothetical protein
LTAYSSFPSSDTLDSIKHMHMVNRAKLIPFFVSYLGSLH